MNEEIMARISAVQAKHIDDLMEKENVVGVGIGMKQVKGEWTDMPSIVVMVSKKMPLEKLDEEDIIPSELDGVAIDVQETGVFATF
jgi:hypothetical protein